MMTGGGGVVEDIVVVVVESIFQTKSNSNKSLLYKERSFCIISKLLFK